MSFSGLRRRGLRQPGQGCWCCPCRSTRCGVPQRAARLGCGFLSHKLSLLKILDIFRKWDSPVPKVKLAHCGCLTLLPTTTAVRRFQVKLISRLKRATLPVQTRNLAGDKLGAAGLAQPLTLCFPENCTVAGEVYFSHDACTLPGGSPLLEQPYSSPKRSGRKTS